MNEYLEINEFLVLLGIVDSVGWVFLFVLFTAAVGMVIFDGQPRKARAEETPLSQERMAA